jgi:hypothetical protein
MKKLTEIVNDISTTLNETGYELIKEDRESLYKLIQSEQFLQDLKKNEVVDKISTESYFFILLSQLERKIDNDQVLNKFIDIYNKTNNERTSNVSRKNIKEFLTVDHKNYIANICKYFLDRRFTEKIPGQQKSGNFKYIYKMIDEIQNSNEKNKFYVSCHIGHFSLYKSAICRKNIEHRNQTKNRIMTLRDYKKYGQTYYKKASKYKIDKETNKILNYFSKKYDMVRSVIDTMFSKLTSF